jgi:hypothetical protein
MIHNIRPEESLDNKKFKIGDLIKNKGSMYAIIGYKSDNKIVGYALLDKKDLTFKSVEKTIKEAVNSLTIKPSDTKNAKKEKIDLTQ